MPNPELTYNLDQAVDEVLASLYGLELSYVPEQERYYVITRMLNRAMRAVATENEWSYYSSTEDIGTVHTGTRVMDLRNTVRPRIQPDDSVKLTTNDGQIVTWAYFLPREAIDKTPDRSQLWVAHAVDQLVFSRFFRSNEEGLHCMVPVMREPEMFRLPARPTDPNAEPTEVPEDVREQLVDFQWPDLVILKASYFYAQTDPIMQPRVQTLDANYKDQLYNLIERDNKNTDAPSMNPFFVPVENSINGGQTVSHRAYGEQPWGHTFGDKIY